jgi:hypothetical protein
LVRATPGQLAAEVLVADLEVARIRVPFEVRWLEQPRVGLAHRPRPRHRPQVGRALLAPALAAASRQPSSTAPANTATIAATSSSTAWPD